MIISCTNNHRKVPGTCKVPGHDLPRSQVLGTLAPRSLHQPYQPQEMQILVPYLPLQRLVDRTQPLAAKLSQYRQYLLLHIRRQDTLGAQPLGSCIPTLKHKVPKV